MLRLSPISFALNDAIKPLSSDVRRNKKRPELIQRALQTATGSREVMVAILMIRQYREFIPKDAPVSHAIIDALLNLMGVFIFKYFMMLVKILGIYLQVLRGNFLLS